MSVEVTSYVNQAIIANEKGTRKGSIGTANDVVNQAKANAQFSKGYQTGQTRAGLMWRSTDDEGGFEAQGVTQISTVPKKTQVIVGVSNDHAVYPEFGTRNMAAQPYLRPAIDAVTNGTSAAKAMAKAMESSVDRVLK